MIFKKKGYGSQLNVCKCSWWKRENGDINQVPYSMGSAVLGVLIAKHVSHVLFKTCFMSAISTNILKHVRAYSGQNGRQIGLM